MGIENNKYAALIKEQEEILCMYFHFASSGLLSFNLEDLLTAMAQKRMDSCKDDSFLYDTFYYEVSVKTRGGYGQ